MQTAVRAQGDEGTSSGGQGRGVCVGGAGGRGGRQGDERVEEVRGTREKGRVWNQGCVYNRM